MNRKLFIGLFVWSLFWRGCQPASVPEVERPWRTTCRRADRVEEEPTAVPEPTAHPEPTEEVSQEPILELIGPDSTISFSMADLKALPATEGMAGIKSSTGKITLPNKFKGVALQDLADLVGGLNESMGVNIVAEDGYSLSYSYDQILNGTILPKSGQWR